MKAVSLSSTTTMRARLQQATLALHRSVERHFSLDCAWTADAYRRLLERLWGIYVPLESSLALIDWKDSGIDACARAKSAWLKADLSYSGLSPATLAALPHCHDLPALATLADGLGAFYVLEGATLGGRVILNTLEPQLGISPGAGGRFFASYGPAVGLQWRRYLEALERACTAPAMADSIADSAMRTFESFDRWFARPGLAQASAAVQTPELIHAQA